MMDYPKGIEKDLSAELMERIVLHRDRFKELFKARYMEMLPSLIKYRNDLSVSVDFMKVEVALRNNYDVVIGETLSSGTRKLQVIGWADSALTTGNPADLFSGQKLTHGAIRFVIPENQRLPFYTEITHDDECQSGNFVVLRNKTLNYTNDYGILDHYIDELAEIQLSRFSIAMQIKIQTIFLGEPNDESVNELVTALYNGAPYSKVSKLFDPKDQIYHMDNSGLAANFQELKREYQNKIGELNNMLGMNSLAVEKSSGVSDEEAQSNRSYTTSNANIYLDARNNGLQKLNKRYELQLEAMYNDEVVSEFEEIAKENEAAEATGGETGDNNPV